GRISRSWWDRAHQLDWEFLGLGGAIRDRMAQRSDRHDFSGSLRGLGTRTDRRRPYPSLYAAAGSANVVHSMSLCTSFKGRRVRRYGGRYGWNHEMRPPRMQLHDRAQGTLWEVLQ